MKSSSKLLAMTVLVAAALSGCGGGGGGYGGGSSPPPPAVNPPAPPPTPPASVGFTAYSKQMHAAPERDLPWDIESVSFTFDGDQDPAAYDELFPPPES